MADKDLATAFIIVLSFLIFVLISLFVPITQFKSVPIINENNFKTKQIKKLSFLFRGLYGGDVKLHGVIYPMYILHIIGYVMGAVSSAVVLLMYFAFNVDVHTTGVTGFVIIANLVVIYEITLFILWVISKKRDKKKDSLCE